jgi:hypothetical protein
MDRESEVARLDEPLILKLAGLSKGSQRWLRTAIYAVASASELAEEEERRSVPRKPRARPEPRAEAPPAASLEDVITGRANLREHLDAYPELAGELEGLADIIDMLREAGEARRRSGEQILREEILGDKEPEEEDENGNERHREPRV